jgi:hypothetical protein
LRQIRDRCSCCIPYIDRARIDARCGAVPHTIACNVGLSVWIPRDINALGEGGLRGEEQSADDATALGLRSDGPLNAMSTVSEPVQEHSARVSRGGTNMLHGRYYPPLGSLLPWPGGTAFYKLSSFLNVPVTTVVPTKLTGPAAGGAAARFPTTGIWMAVCRRQNGRDGTRGFSHS